MADLRVKPLDEHTWPDFAALVERHNGVTRVSFAARLPAAEDCVGWCQFGPLAELPRIKHRRAYEAGLAKPPDWRITCFFVDRTHRRAGVAATALGGAPAEIARLGGGTVESYPEDTEGRKVSASFLHNGTVALFERHGFARTPVTGALPRGRQRAA